MNVDVGPARRVSGQPVTWSMWIVAAAVAMAPPAVRAQERPVAWTATAASAATAIVPGGVDTVRLTAQIAPGWHMYSITQGAGGPFPTRIMLAPSQPFTLADAVRGPAPTQQFDSNFGIAVESYVTHAVFVVPVRITPDAPVGPNAIALSARYQVCNATLCMPPRTERISVPVTIAPMRAKSVSSTG
jgi:DsbC/DsbD-like thiol-disulfide interchange protein